MGGQKPARWGAGALAGVVLAEGLILQPPSREKRLGLTGPLRLGQFLPDGFSLQEPAFKSYLLSWPQLPHPYTGRLDSMAAKDPLSSDTVGS